MHLQEFAENSADPQHFQPIHDRAYFPFSSIALPFVEVRHATQWSGPTNHSKHAIGSTVLDTPAHYAATGEVRFEAPHLATFSDSVYIRFMGKDVVESLSKAEITFVGPGGLAFFRLAVPQVGLVHMIQTMTPLSLCVQRVDFAFYAPASVPTLLLHYVTGNWIHNFQQDIAVWENKIFLPKPLLVKGDGPIMAMRRWYQQFYPPGMAKVSIHHICCPT
jgi:hypothetical protein